jgi:hypothetical protein
MARKAYELSNAAVMMWAADLYSEYVRRYYFTGRNISEHDLAAVS